MVGRNTLSLCPAEMKRAMQPYVDELFGVGEAEIENIRQERDGGVTSETFIIKVIKPESP